MRGQDAISLQGAAGRSPAPASSPVAALTLDVDGDGQAASPPAATARSTPSSRRSAKLYPHTATLQLYQVNAVTEGTDAQAEVTVRLEENGRTVTGKALGHRHAGGRRPRPM